VTSERLTAEALVCLPQPPGDADRARVARGGRAGRARLRARRIRLVARGHRRLAFGGRRAAAPDRFAAERPSLRGPWAPVQTASAAWITFEWARNSRRSFTPLVLLALLIVAFALATRSRTPSSSASHTGLLVDRMSMVVLDGGPPSRDPPADRGRGRGARRDRALLRQRRVPSASSARDASVREKPPKRPRAPPVSTLESVVMVAGTTTPVVMPTMAIQ